MILLIEADIEEGSEFCGNCEKRDGNYCPVFQDLLIIEGLEFGRCNNCIEAEEDFAEAIRND